MGTFSATRYSEQFILNLDRSTVAREITNQDYTPIEGARAVELYAADDLSAPGKNADNSVNIQSPSGNSQTMTLDEERDLSVGIPSIEEFQSQVDMQRKFRGRQAQAGEEALDDHVLGKHAQAGIDLSTTASTPSGFADKVRDAKVALSDNDVPRAGRYMVLSPHYADLLSEDAGDRIDQNRDIETDGYIGRYQGFDLFESTGIPEAGSKQHLTFGHRSAHTLAVQMSGVALVQNSEQATFHGDVLKSLMVFSSKVQIADAYGDLEADIPS